MIAVLVALALSAAPDSAAVAKPPLTATAPGIRMAAQVGVGIPVQALSEIAGFFVAWGLISETGSERGYGVVPVYAGVLPTALAVWGSGKKLHRGNGAFSTTAFGAAAGATVAVVPLLMARDRDANVAVGATLLAALVVVPLGAAIGYHNSIDAPASPRSARIGFRHATLSGIAVVPLAGADVRSRADDGASGSPRRSGVRCVGLSF